jgi:hypothetical protein
VLQSPHVGQLALPDNLGLPAKFAQETDVLEVTATVPGQFRHPKIKPRFRKASECAAWMSVPEATVHKNHFVAAWENQIGLAGERLPM